MVITHSLNFHLLYVKKDFLMEIYKIHLSKNLISSILYKVEKIIEAKNLTKVYGEDGTSVTALNKMV